MLDIIVIILTYNEENNWQEIYLKNINALKV